MCPMRRRDSSRDSVPQERARYSERARISGQPQNAPRSQGQPGQARSQGQGQARSQGQAYPRSQAPQGQGQVPRQRAQQGQAYPQGQQQAYPQQRQPRAQGQAYPQGQARQQQQQQQQRRAYPQGQPAPQGRAYPQGQAPRQQQAYPQQGQPRPQGQMRQQQGYPAGQVPQQRPQDPARQQRPAQPQGQQRPRQGQAYPQGQASQRVPQQRAQQGQPRPQRSDGRQQQRQPQQRAQRPDGRQQRTQQPSQVQRAQRSGVQAQRASQSRAQARPSQGARTSSRTSAVRSGAPAYQARRSRSRKLPIPLIAGIALIAVVAIGILAVRVLPPLFASGAEAVQEATSNESPVERATKRTERAKELNEAETAVATNLYGSTVLSDCQVRTVKAQVIAEERDYRIVEDIKPEDGSTDRVAYLTFDDGPSPDNTQKVLDVLFEKEVPGTFFVVGSRGEPEEAYEEESYGNVVALHSNNHTYDLIYESEESYLADIDAIGSSVERIVGHKVRVTRFPGGSSNTVNGDTTGEFMPALGRALNARGYQFFDWNVSSGDAVYPPLPAADIVENITEPAKEHQRICVLMHDSEEKETTVEALPQVIDELKAQGYVFGVLTADTFPFHHIEL